MANEAKLAIFDAKKAPGFTLIELLLVIAILGVIASFVIPAFRERTVSAKVDKAALQMQQLLQAGSAYYLDSGNKWPGDSREACDYRSCYQDSQNKEICFKDRYVPINGLQNPWGQQYCYSPVIVNDEIDSNLFQVETQAPSEQLAKRIAARLPNAEASPDTTGQWFVKAQVGRPGVSSGGAEGDVSIIAIGEIGGTPSCGGAGNDTENCTWSDTVPAIPVNSSPVECPAGWQPYVVTAIAHFRSPLDGTKQGRAWPVNSVTASRQDCTTSQQNGVQCPVSYTVNISKYAGRNVSMKIQYIVYCQRPNTTQQAKTGLF